MPSGAPLYLFDIENQILTNENVKYAMVNAYPLENDETALMAHIVLKDTARKLKDVLSSLDLSLQNFLPKGMDIHGYKIQVGRFKASPTTAKIDRNSYYCELDGYLNPEGDRLRQVSLFKNNEGKYAIR